LIASIILFAAERFRVPAGIGAWAPHLQHGAIPLVTMASSGIHEADLRRIIENRTVQLARETLPNQELRVTVPCSPAEKGQLLSMFPHQAHRIVFNPKSGARIHPLPAASEEILRKSFLRGFASHPSISYIGENPVEFAELYKPGDHNCLLVADGRDEQRHRARLTTLAKREKSTVGSEKRATKALVRTAFHTAAVHGNSSDIVCATGFGQCGHKSDVGVAMFSLHDMRPRDVLPAMVRKDMTKLYSVMFIPDELPVTKSFDSPEKGYWFRPHTRATVISGLPTLTQKNPKALLANAVDHFLHLRSFDEDTEEDLVEIGFYGREGKDIAEPYIHSRSALIEWATASAIHGPGSNLHVEVVHDHGPVKVFACSRVTHEIRSARIWRTGFEGSSKVARLSALARANYDPARLEDQDWILCPTDNIEAVRMYLTSAKKIDLEVAMKYGRARQSGLFVGADVIQKRWEVSADDFEEIIATVYVVSNMARLKHAKEVAQTLDHYSGGFFVRLRDWFRSLLGVSARKLPALMDRCEEYIHHRTSIRGHSINLPWKCPVYPDLNQELLEIEASENGGTSAPAPPTDKAKIPKEWVQAYVDKLVGDNPALSAALTSIQTAVKARLAPLDDVDVSALDLIIGPPGCGKTHYARHNLVGSDTLIIVPTNSLAEEWDNMRVNGARVATQHTALRLLLSGTYSTVIVDEASLFPVSYFALLAFLKPTAKITLLGDPKQIAYIDWNAAYTNAEELRLDHHVAKFTTRTLLRNWRNPPGTVRLLNKLFGYNMLAEKKKDVPWLATEQFDATVGLFETATIMTYGQAAKEMFVARFPGREVKTVQEMQGLTRNSVILHVDEDSFPVQNSPVDRGHHVVAFSRHRERLFITEVDREKLAARGVDCSEAFIVLDAAVSVTPELAPEILAREKKPQIVAEPGLAAPDIDPIEPREADEILQKHCPSRKDEFMPAEVVYDLLPRCAHPIKIDVRALADADSPVPERSYLGVHQRGKYTAGTPVSTLSTFMTRFGKDGVLPINPIAVKAEASRLCSQLVKFAFKPKLQFAADDFYRAMEASLINMAEKGTLDRVAIMEEALVASKYSGFQKKQLKVKAGAIDPAYRNKAGQTIVSTLPELNIVMGPLAIYLASLIKQNLKEQFVLHDGQTIQETCQGAVLQAQRGTPFGGTDLTEQDSSFNMLHNMVKHELIKHFMQHLGDSIARLVNIELLRMKKWKVFINEVVSMVIEWMNQSGNSWTLICNSLMSLSIIPEVVTLEELRWFGFVGDDTLYFADKITWHDEAATTLNDKYGTQVKKENMIVPTLCKSLITQDGCFTDIVKVASAAINKPQKDKTYLEAYQVSLRDVLGEWPTEERFAAAIAASATAHRIPLVDVRRLAGVVQYVANTTWDDFERESHIPLEHTKIVVTPAAIRDASLRLWSNEDAAKFLERNPLVSKPKFLPDSADPLIKQHNSNVRDHIDQNGPPRPQLLRKLGGGGRTGRPRSRPLDCGPPVDLLPEDRGGLERCGRRGKLDRTTRDLLRHLEHDDSFGRTTAPAPPNCEVRAQAAEQEASHLLLDQSAVQNFVEGRATSGSQPPHLARSEPHGADDALSRRAASSRTESAPSTAVAAEALATIARRARTLRAASDVDNRATSVFPVARRLSGRGDHGPDVLRLQSCRPSGGYGAASLERCDSSRRCLAPVPARVRPPAPTPPVPPPFRLTDSQCEDFRIAMLRDEEEDDALYYTGDRSTYC
jgi:hypothetical protein